MAFYYWRKFEEQPKEKTTKNKNHLGNHPQYPICASGQFPFSLFFHMLVHHTHSSIQCSELYVYEQIYMYMYI